MITVLVVIVQRRKNAWGFSLFLFLFFFFILWVGQRASVHEYDTTGRRQLEAELDGNG